MTFHLAILYKDYLEKILSGTKTIESRFAKVRCAPYGQVHTGDVLILKETSGPVRGLVGVTRVLTYSGLNPCKAQQIIDKYGQRLCLEDDFTEKVFAARYATLMFLAEPRSVDPFLIPKKDRRAWVVLSSQLSFMECDPWQRRLVSLGSPEPSRRGNP